MTDHTYSTIIERALLEIGVVAGGETPEAHLLNEGMLQLREMLDAWSIEGLLSPGTEDYEIEFDADNISSVLTIGPVVDPSDPPSIKAADIPFSIIHIEYGTNGETYPLYPRSPANFLDDQQYFDGGYEGSPIYYWYEPDHPYGKIRLNSSPVSGESLTVTVKKYLISDGVGLTDNPQFLRGYERAIRLNLAVEMASSNGIKGGQLSPLTIMNAKDSKVDLMAVNVQRKGQAKVELAALGNSRRLGGAYGEHHNRVWATY